MNIQTNYHHLTKYLVIVGSLVLLFLAGGIWFMWPRDPIYQGTPGTDVIVFETDRDVGFQLYVIQPDGSGQTRLTYHVARSQGLLWFWPPPFADLIVNQALQPAPLGRGIFYISNFEGPNRFYTMRLDGTPSIPFSIPLTDWSSVRPSPDGQRIAFSDDESHVILINRDGSGEHCLTCTMTGMRVEGFSWSPDNQSLVASLHTDTAGNLFRIQADGSGVIQLTNATDFYNRMPDWSPDGSFIVFISDEGQSKTGTDIYVMRADGSDVRRLTTTKSEADPTWSPDGTHITFDSARDGRPSKLGGHDIDIYVMRADGSEQTRLTNGPGSNMNPTWIRIP